MTESHTKQSKRWCFTINNVKKEAVDLEPFDYAYLILADEVAPTTGTEHVQGYVVFNKNHRLSAVKKLNSTAHWEIAKGTTDQNVTYCQKDGQYVEYGDKPKSRAQIGKDNKARWADIIKCAEEGTAKEHYPQEYLRFNGTITRMHQPKLESNDELCGLWYYGESGTGKSKAAREHFPGAYDKNLNKWWDNYRHEPFVIMDDLDHFHAPQMGPALKRYADHYPFRAEVKGSSMMVRPKKIIVTTQYTIEELWPYDQSMQDAIRRRFKVVRFFKI